MMIFTILSEILCSVCTSQGPQKSNSMMSHKGCSTLLTLVFGEAGQATNEANLKKLLEMTSLSLAGRRLSEVPEYICELVNLTDINLEANLISALPKQFSNLKNLKTLNLANNLFTGIPEPVLELPNLVTLNLRHNRIKNTEFGRPTDARPVVESTYNTKRIESVSIPAAHTSPPLKSFKTLNLSQNYIRLVSKMIFDLPNLQNLFVKENMIIELPNDLSISDKLGHLDLSGNQLSSFQPFILSTNNLKILNLSNNFFIEIPNSIRNLTSLTKLEFMDNGITTIPNFITDLPNITHLNLKNNHLSSIIEDIGHLDCLVHLDLSDNYIKVLPPSLFKMIHLDNLNLSCNRLGSISDNLSNLSNLKALNISDNFDDYGFLPFPKAIFSLLNLRNLKMRHISLTDLNESELSRLGNLRELLALDLSFVGISKVPSVIYKLSNLKYLNLEGNIIEDIEDEILNLRQLQGLNLGACGLSSINSNICRLKTLKLLNIGFNPLKKLPDGLGMLISLKKLDVSYTLKDFAALENKRMLPASLETLCMKGCPNALSRPDIFKGCDNVHHLCMNNCKLTEINGLPGMFPSLICLDITENTIENFEPLERIPKLLHLNARGNGILEVPVEITSLVLLQTLDLSYNNILKLPSAVGNLSHLATFNLAGNMIEGIVPEIGMLENLKVITLKSKFFDCCKVPESIAQISRLRILDLPSISCFNSFHDEKIRNTFKTQYLRNQNFEKYYIYYYNYSDIVGVPRESEPETRCLWKRFQKDSELYKHVKGWADKLVILFNSTEELDESYEKIKNLKYDRNCHFWSFEIPEETMLYS